MHIAEAVYSEGNGECFYRLSMVVMAVNNALQRQGWSRAVKSGDKPSRLALSSFTRDVAPDDTKPRLLNDHKPPRAELPCEQTSLTYFY